MQSASPKPRSTKKYGPPVHQARQKRLSGRVWARDVKQARMLKQAWRVRWVESAAALAGGGVGVGGGIAQQAHLLHRHHAGHLGAEEWPIPAGRAQKGGELLQPDRGWACAGACRVRGAGSGCMPSRWQGWGGSLPILDAQHPQPSVCGWSSVTFYEFQF